MVKQVPNQIGAHRDRDMMQKLAGKQEVIVAADSLGDAGLPMRRPGAT